MCGAFAVTRLMASLLYGVTATDAVTFGCVSLLLGFTSLAATYIPASRAIRLDPTIALRHE
jgi:ABC-type lipoprotein release transport system permease subunit